MIAVQCFVDPVEYVPLIAVAAGVIAVQFPTRRRALRSIEDLCAPGRQAGRGIQDGGMVVALRDGRDWRPISGALQIRSWTVVAELQYDGIGCGEAAA